MNETPHAVAGAEQNIRHGILALWADADNDTIVALTVDVTGRYLDDDSVVNGNAASGRRRWERSARCCARRRARAGLPVMHRRYAPRRSE